jgi:hypothetical protein
MPAPKRWVTVDVSHYFPEAPHNEDQTARQKQETLALFREQMQEINYGSPLGEMVVEDVFERPQRKLLIAVRMPSDGYVRMSHQLAGVPGVISVSR